jgi:hypothetical protein
MFIFLASPHRISQRVIKKYSRFFVNSDLEGIGLSLLYERLCFGYCVRLRMLGPVSGESPSAVGTARVRVAMANGCAADKAGIAQDRCEIKLPSGS